MPVRIQRSVNMKKQVYNIEFAFTFPEVFQLNSRHLYFGIWYNHFETVTKKYLLLNSNKWLNT